MDTESRVYVSGHRGMVGQAFVRVLREKGYGNLILRSRSDLDLRQPEAVAEFFEETRPEVVIMAAAKVGGIAANMAAPADFLVDNLKIQTNVLSACHAFEVVTTVFLGSSCVYPRKAPQPMKESALLTGPLEPTNEAYAVAKIAGLKMAQYLRDQYGMSVICPMPCNLYGPNDRFDLNRSHVVSALVRRFVEASEEGSDGVVLWGTGSAQRELMHVDDLVSATLFLVENYDSSEIINVGTGRDHSIKDLAEIIAEKAQYRGAIGWDDSKPDGMPRKVLDVSRIRDLGWKHSIELETGLDSVIADFRSRELQPLDS